MADRVLFMGWTQPHIGRENEASELFSSMIAYFTKQQSLGNIEGFEPVLLQPHGGDMNGFFLVRGSHEKLSTLTNSDEYLTLQTRTAINVSGFGVIPGYCGDGVAKQMERWRNNIKK